MARKNVLIAHVFGTKKKENEYVCPSDSDESFENEQFRFLLQPNARVTAVSSPEEPPSRENTKSWKHFNQLLPNVSILIFLLQ